MSVKLATLKTPRSTIAVIEPSNKCICGKQFTTSEEYCYHISHDPPYGCEMYATAFSRTYWPYTDAIALEKYTNRSQGRSVVDGLCSECHRNPPLSDRKCCRECKRSKDRERFIKMKLENGK